jgi:hypothetical protein
MTAAAADLNAALRRVAPPAAMPPPVDASADATPPPMNPSSSAIDIDDAEILRAIRAGEVMLIAPTDYAVLYQAAHAGARAAAVSSTLLAVFAPETAPAGEDAAPYMDLAPALAEALDRAEQVFGAAGAAEAAA